MRLLSWNVAAREGKLAQQLSQVLGEEPDVVALQEVSRGTHARWRQGLAEAGYSLLASDDLLALPTHRPHTRSANVPRSRSSGPSSI